MIVCSILYEHLRTVLKILMLMYKLNASIYTCTCMYHPVSNCMTILHNIQCITCTALHIIIAFYSIPIYHCMYKCDILNELLYDTILYDLSPLTYMNTTLSYLYVHCKILYHLYILPIVTYNIPDTTTL